MNTPTDDTAADPFLPLSPPYRELMDKISAGEFDGAFSLNDHDINHTVRFALHQARVEVDPAQDFDAYTQVATLQLVSLLGLH